MHFSIKSLHIDANKTKVHLVAQNKTKQNKTE